VPRLTLSAQFIILKRLAVLLLAIAVKTLGNYANHPFHTPVADLVRLTRMGGLSIAKPRLLTDGGCRLSSCYVRRTLWNTTKE